MAVASRPLAKTATAGREEPATVFDLVMKFVAYVVLIAVALAMFIPFVFSLATSLKTTPEAYNLTWSNMFTPANPTIDAYRTLRDTQIVRWFGNSAGVAAVIVIAHAVTDAMAGYAFARMRFFGRDVVFLLVLSTMMVPPIVLIIPRFIILKDLHIINTYGALTIPFLADAFGIFLMKQFFETIPKELEEAARLDGASRYRMFAQIILPNAMPALTALAIFSFQGSWNSFLDPLIFISGSNQKLFTLPLGLAYFHQTYFTNWPVVMAISVITTVPMAIVFLIFQRYFVEGATTSGIK